MTNLQVGKVAPNFTLPDQNNQKISLEQFRGKWVVLYFYPRAMTPGCTVQACALRDYKKELKDLNAVALGISPDKPASLKKFEEKESLNFTLLGDEDHKVAEEFGVWVEKSMYGKKYMGMARATFVINPAGEVVHIIPKASPKSHHEDVIKVLKENIN